MNEYNHRNRDKNCETTKGLKKLSKINDFLKNYKLAKLMPQAQKT